MHMRWILHGMFIWKIYVQLSRKLRSLGKKMFETKVPRRKRNRATRY